MARQVASLYTSLTLESSSFVANMRKTADATQRQAKMMERGFNAAKLAVAGFIGAFSVHGLANMARGYAQTVDTVRRLDAQLRIASGSSLDFATNQRASLKAAQDFGTTYGNIAPIIGNVSRALRDMGRGTAEAEGVARAIAAASRIAGGGAGVQAALTQLNQALGSGVLRGEEFNSIMEQMQPLAFALAKALGVTTGELRNMAQEGELTSGVVIDALLKMQGELERQAQSIEVGLGDAWAVMTDKAARALADFDEGGQFSRSVVDWAMRGSDAISGIGTSAYEAGANIRAAFQTVGDILAPLVSAAQTASRWLDNLGAAISRLTGARLSGGAFTSGFGGLAKRLDMITYPLRAIMATGPAAAAAARGEGMAEAWSKQMRLSSLDRALGDIFEVHKKANEAARRKRDVEALIAEMIRTPVGGKKARAGESAGDALAAGMDRAAKAITSVGKAANDSRSALADFISDMEPVTVQAAEAWERLASRVELVRFPTPPTPDFELDDAWLRGIGDRAAEEIDKARKAGVDFAREFGFTMSSALEDAIVNFRSFGDVARGILQDILRMLTRQFVTNPLAGIIGGLFGGFRASGGPVGAGMAYVVGERGPELFVPRSAGRIIANDNFGRAGSVIVNQTIAPQFAGNAATREEVLAMGRIAKEQAIIGVREVMSRRGSWR